jgi:hypothetical protein
MDGTFEQGTFGGHRTCLMVVNLSGTDDLDGMILLGT